MRVALLGLVTLGVCASPAAWAYPTDPAAQELTKIRRLKWQQDINEGTKRGTKIPEGAQWPLSAVKLRMLTNPSFDVTATTAPDPELQKGLEALLARGRFRRFNIAVLDITNPAAPRYAAVNPTEQQTPGSTAKPLLAAGMFQLLKERFPEDMNKRRELMRQVLVKADDWAMPNHHEVPVVTGDVYGKDYQTAIRAVRTGDQFSLYEWMDHALSPSSNASASMLWREATLMRLLGAEYPPAAWDAALFKRWDREAFTAAAFEVVDQPLRDAGLNVDDFFIRLFFTKGAGKFVKGDTSRASPLGLLRWLLRVEQGRMVDADSSLELKRMLYLTRRRIRYSKAKALDRSAVFFKTGSLYQCKPEEGYTCMAYMGNELNVLNALITVESPPEPTPVEGASGPSGPSGASGPAPVVAPAEPELVYLVAVMSNELKRNAATDHEVLGGEIHALIKQLHAAPVAAAEPAPAPVK